jgi:putative endonuclease
MIINQEIKSQKTSIVTEVKYLYFITNANRTAIEIGITEDIIQFSKTHKIKPDLFEGYTEANTRLVYFEAFNSAFQAKDRLLMLKQWTRAQKEKLIRAINPDWVDLANTILKEPILGVSLLKTPIVQQANYRFN